MRPDNDRYTLFVIEYEERIDRKAWECVGIKPVTWGLTHQQVSAVANNMYRFDVTQRGDETWNRYWMPAAVLDGCSLPKQHLMVPHCFDQWKRNYYELIDPETK